MLNVQLKRKRTFAQSVLFVVFLLSSTLAFAQNKVTGTVTDKSGEPLAGVNVLEKGTTNGCITDLDGKYSIEVKRGQTLIFTFIGFTKKEVQVNQSAINVVMEEDSQTLDEVVVVGYGSMTRKDVTSSITTVKADDLNVGVYTNPAQLLQGKVPGLTIANTSDPNGSASISLRGTSSLREGAAMEPYYVIDGVPGVSLSLIAPEDIESIDVLRDASATAIYGSKAANGVIIVTTKKGSKNGKTNVNYSGYVAIDNTLKTLDMMNASELLAYANANNVDLSPYYDVNNPADTNWQDEVLRSGFSHNHNISINGGNEKTTYSASLNYIDREGVVRGTSMDRITARSFLQTKTLKDHLDLSVSVNASITNKQTASTENQGRSVLDAMYYYNPLVPVKNADGSWYANTSISQSYNPLSMVYEDQYKTKEKMLQGIAKATLHIIDGLDWNLNLSYQNEQYIYSNYNTTQSQLPNISSRHGQASRSTKENIKKQMETYVNYDHVFADKHKLGLMAGYSWEQNDDNDGFGLTVYNFYDDYLKYYNMGLANNMDIDGINSDNKLSTLRMISFYGRVNYSFNSKYLFQATIRRDGSSAFGKNNRWGTFPSVSLAWRITEENFMKNQKVFDDLKFRIGYGVSGNSLGFDAYTAQQTYGASGWFTYVDPVTGSSSSYRTLAATKNANPDLKWERTGMFNVGIDFGFFNNRLTGTFEIFKKKNDNMLVSRLHPGVLGGIAPSTNSGKFEANGYDVSLTWHDKIGSFNYHVGGTLTYMTNKLVDGGNIVVSAGYNEAVNGYPLNSVFGYRYVGKVQNQDQLDYYVDKYVGSNSIALPANLRLGDHMYEDVNKDGKLTQDDLVFLGSDDPKYSFSFNFGCEWKGFDFNTVFQGVGKRTIYREIDSWKVPFKAIWLNTTNQSVGNVWSPETPNNHFPTYSNSNDINNYNYIPSTWSADNGAYLRLKEIVLGYTLPKAWMNKSGFISNLRIYVSGADLWEKSYITDGWDPEATRKVENKQRYPFNRTVTFGVNATF